MRNVAKRRRRTTAKQRVASRRNLIKARRKRSVLSSRNIKIGVAATVGTAAVVGGAITARKAYNKQFTTFYHGTGHHQARMIVKHGYDNKKSQAMMGVRGGDRNRLYVQRQPSDYGRYQVQVKVRNKYVHLMQPDYNDFHEGVPAFSISARGLAKARKAGIIKLSHRVPRRHRTRYAVRNLEMYGTYKRPDWAK